MSNNYLQEPIITILGPTATGKTKVAVQVAQHLNGEIISVDSRQIFRRMDIGTGKDLADYSIGEITIPTYLIDIEEPGIEYNVFRYQQAAFDAMQKIRKKNKRIILCGGSGMYIEAILRGYRLFPVPENDELRNTLASKTDFELIDILSSYKSLHNDTDTSERDRLVRAIEIEEHYKNHPELNERVKPIDSCIIGLCGNRDEIRSKITKRLHERLKEGLVDEVQRLINEGIDPQRLIRYGLEYKFVTKYIIGQLSYDDMVEQLNIAIHQFSKRQMTWFRRMERMGFNIHWVDIALPNKEKMNDICSFLSKNGINI